MNNYGYLLLIISIVVLHAISCKSDNASNQFQIPEINQMDSTLTKAEDIKGQLLVRADSMMKMNEFEAIKIQNIINMMDENVVSLQKYKDTLTQSPDKITFDRILPLSTTQVTYVNTLISSAEAILDNRSFSFGKWKDGLPKQINDTILTPVKK